ncbi:MAG: hypothetical protein WA173_07280 [Pseudomonas sp.]|uniref:hypothetical protein n=1 Tax=Pseudomonas sp. TaxID=306 RepID=UPI003BB4E1BB
MKKLLTLLSALIFFAPQFSIASEESDCPASTASADYYFPKNQLNPELEQSLDDIDQTLYTSTLSAINEPSYSCDFDERGLRFIWLRTKNNPVVIRVDGKYRDRQFKMTATELNSTSASVVRREVRVLNDTERDKIRAMLARSAILTSPTDKVSLEPNISQWAFEYREEDRYYLVTRRSPSADNDMRKIGTYLIELTGWTFSNDDIF